MASAVLKAQLETIVKTMMMEGQLDQQFREIQALQDVSSPGFVWEVITLFCKDTERLLTGVDKLMNGSVVDFESVVHSAHQLKGSCASVGAHKMKLVCTQFRQFSEVKDKERCLQAFDALKHEYRYLQSNFEAILQLEQRIKASENTSQI